MAQVLDTGRGKDRDGRQWVVLGPSQSESLAGEMPLFLSVGSTITVTSTLPSFLTCMRVRTYPRIGVFLFCVFQAWFEEASVLSCCSGVRTCRVYLLWKLGEEKNVSSTLLCSVPGACELNWWQEQLTGEKSQNNKGKSLLCMYAGPSQERWENSKNHLGLRACIPF